MSDEDEELAAWRARAAAYDAERARRPVSVKEAIAGDEAYGPPRQVRCRECGRPTEMSGFAWWCAKRSSEVLMRKGEAPLEENDIMLCQDCRALRDAREAEEHAAVYAKQVSLIRGAKERGYLTTEESRWLIQHDLKETHDALEARFQREAEKKAGGNKARQRALDLEEP